jgi:hypothetical protein
MTYEEANILVGKFVEKIKEIGSMNVGHTGSYAYTTGFLASWIAMRVAENPKLVEKLKAS